MVSQRPAAKGSFITLRTGKQEKEMVTQEPSKSWSHWGGDTTGGMEPLSEQGVVYPDLSLLLPSSLRCLPLVKPNQNPAGT